MSKTFKIYVGFLLFMVLSFMACGQAGKMHPVSFLLADREFCISGDTLWFKVFHKNGDDHKGNIAHVQLTTAENKLISETYKSSVAGWAEGHLPVPDSLSTGVYFLSAFFSGQNTNHPMILQKKSLFVYNRFQKTTTEFPVPAVSKGNSDKNFKTKVPIKPASSVFRPREKVTAEINMKNIHAAGIDRVVVKAGYLDEFAAEAGGNFLVQLTGQQEEVPEFEEKNGILIRGKVVNPTTARAGENVMMLLSLPDNPHYFDYYITSGDGIFYFFLKDAYGEGEIVLQAFSEGGEQWKVTLGKENMDVKEPLVLENRLLSAAQSRFIEEMVDASFYNRLFGEAYALSPAGFEMPDRFEIPFYGKPYERVVLDDFIELPGFHEISRELLHGVQYRERNDEITLRMLNLEAKHFFEDQPLRLINGIPVFSNSLLAPLGSKDVDYIDYVLEDRVYGDLRFSGVLAVYLKDQSNRWMAGQPNLFRFKVPLLQFESSPSYMDAPRIDDNIPDM
ncbi:MAG: hypothetical protein ACOC0R_05670 [Mariniphaga sp.]